jgi:peptidoglycan/xylan/chitin deacetylase (PgdA/CDA1 family)
MDTADEIYAGDGSERVLCGLGVDGEGIALQEIERAMARALDQHEVLILFAHEPGRTITYERVDRVLALAESLALPYVTFPELAVRRDHAGFSLGFDDFSVDAWFGLREILQARRARVTFFVSNFGELDAQQKHMLHLLEADGHAIEAHGVGHRNAPHYVDTHGLSRYLADEIDPLLDMMARDGFNPTTFAYPYGDRTTEIDQALLARFALLRSLSYLDRSISNSAPCPR